MTGQPSFTPTKTFELLHRVTGHGLSAAYRFTRQTHSFSDKMVDIEIVLANEGDEDLIDVCVTKKVICLTKLSHSDKTRVETNCSLVISNSSSSNERIFEY